MIIKYLDFQYDTGEDRVDPEEAREILANFYPEVNLAQIDRYIDDNGNEVIEFKKKSGTLG